jgi:hypothetical protein
MELGKLGGNKTGFNVEACKVRRRWEAFAQPPILY